MQFTREDLDRTLESRRTAVGRLAATLLELDAERERRAPEAQGLVGASATAWRQGSEELVSMWVAYQELLGEIGGRRGGARRPAAQPGRLDEDRLCAAHARNAVGDLRAVRQAGADSRNHDRHMGGSRPGFAAPRRDRAPSGRRRLGSPASRHPHAERGRYRFATACRTCAGR